MSKSQGQYIKFYAHDDTFAYLKGLPKGQLGGTVNEAVRYYANMQSQTTSAINSVNSVQSPSGVTMGNSVTTDSLRASASSNLMQVSLGSIATPTNGNFIPIPPPPTSAICPNGHLWMNGTQRCVNRKCAYGKTE